VPIIAHLRVFGCVTYAHVPKVKRQKLDTKNIKAIFVGYCTDTKGYRLWNAERQKLLVSRDVIFYKLSIPGHTMPEVFSRLFSFQEIPLDVCTNLAGSASLAQFASPTPPNSMEVMQLSTASHPRPLQQPQVSPPGLHLDEVALVHSSQPMRISGAPSHL